VVAPWFLAVLAREGPAVLDQMFLDQVLGRMTNDAVAGATGRSFGRTELAYTRPMTGVPQGDAPYLLNTSYTITADITVPKGGAEGMIVTSGGRFAGWGFYLLEGRPVFAVYNTDELPCPNRWSDTFREALRPEGIEPYLIRVERYLDRDRRQPSALGFDAAVDFQPLSRSFRAFQRTRPPLPRRIINRVRRELARVRETDTHYDMAAFARFDATRPAPAYTRFPGVCPSWDNSARRPPGKAILFRNSSPDVFRDWVAAKTARFIPPSPQENLFFVNAWNEWAEGNHLEPCLTHGHGWLEALRAGLQAVPVRP